MYQELVKALKDYDFTANEQNGIFSLLACILFLGNVTFEATNVKGAEGSAISSKSSSDIKNAAELLGVDASVRFTVLFLSPIVDFIIALALGFNAVSAV